jgi:hypothetical protein
MKSFSKRTLIATDLIAPPILPAETATHGWLIPANDPMPKTPCTGKDSKTIAADEFLIALGGGGAVFPSDRTTQITVLSVGQCPVVWAKKEGNRVGIDADVFDYSGDLSARIRDNEFHLVPDTYSYNDRPNRNTLLVYDKKGHELFYSDFSNPRVIKIRGVFGCENRHVPVIVTDDAITESSPRLNLRIEASCGYNPGIGVFHVP